MKFVRTNVFLEDWKSLTIEEKKKVKDNFPLVRDALMGNIELRQKFRIKKMTPKRNGIWEGHIEINLVFTLHFEYDEKEKICYFRRIGNHSIYNKP